MAELEKGNGGGKVYSLLPLTPALRPPSYVVTQGYKSHFCKLEPQPQTPGQGGQ